MITENTSLRELAFIVGDAFISSRITAVLSGGGAATIYSKDAYQSQDLDFVLGFTGGIAHIIESLGFREKGAIYCHPKVVWTIEFINDHLAIGEDYDISPVRIQENGQSLDILSPTDCVRDRLAWFLNYNPADYSALSQALAVAKEQNIDLEKIKHWASKQTYPERMEVFVNSVGRK
jgi:hypothetical protein